MADSQSAAKALRKQRVAKYDDSDGQLEYMTWAGDTQRRPAHHGENASGKRHIGQRPVQNAATRSTASSTPSLPPWLRSETSTPLIRYEPPKPRYDPGKKEERRPDGRVNLRGVRANSHVSLYERDFQPYTKRSFEARKAFKLKLLRDAASPATKTWGAVNSWYASSKDWDEFLPLAKEGIRFHEHRNQNLGGQLAPPLHHD